MVIEPLFFSTFSANVLTTPVIQLIVDELVKLAHGGAIAKLGG